eukprot:5460245-Prymnesium_polylepis.2
MWCIAALAAVRDPQVGAIHVDPGADYGRLAGWARDSDRRTCMVKPRAAVSQRGYGEQAVRHTSHAEGGEGSGK